MIRESAPKPGDDPSTVIRPGPPLGRLAREILDELLPGTAHTTISPASEPPRPPVRTDAPTLPEASSPPTPPPAPPLDRLAREMLGDAAVPTELSPPAPSSRYRIHAEIGRGGMGTVYRAHDTVLRRDVALKVLLVGDRAEGSLVDRFQREARAAAALEHPHIIRVLDVGVLPAASGKGPGNPFYTMEMLEGEDLASAIERGRLSVRDGIEVVRQIAHALAYAHDRGILHRDVKPNNVFLRRVGSHPTRALVPTPAHDAEGVRRSAETVARSSAVSAETQVPRAEDPGLHALLLDFGLAKILEHELGSGTDADGRPVQGLTRSGQILGTPVYMAPEQARGSREIDGRADVYGLGATLYHTVTGRPPFDAPTLAELLEAVQREDPPPPRKLSPGLDRDVDTLCLKCLAKEPHQRYANAAELAEDCRRFLADEPLVARPVGALGRLWRRARRNRAVAALAGGLFAMVVVAIGLLLHYAVLPRVHAAAEARRAQADAAERARKATALLADAEGALDEAVRGSPAGAGPESDEAETRRRTGKLTQARSSAEELVRDYRSAFERGEEIPLGDAHLVLARVAHELGNPHAALVECCRAFETAVGSARACERMVALGRQLTAMGQYERAQGCFRQALDLAADPRSEFVAQGEWARGLVRLGRFEEAEALLPVHAADPQATPEERLEFERLRRFASLLTPEFFVESSMHEFMIADLDGDGTPELAGISEDRTSVFVRSLQREDPDAPPAVQLLRGDETYGLSLIAAHDVDGDRIPEILVSGGVSEGGGILAILRRSRDGLRLVARAPIPCHMEGPSFATVDFERDGRIEIVAGLSYQGKRLRIYHLEEPPGYLRLVHESEPLPGDILGVFPRDADGDGNTELWLLLGPWGGYGLSCLEWDPASGLVQRSETAFGREFTVDRSVAAGAENDFLLGSVWTQDAEAPMRTLLGSREMERQFRPTGVYHVTLTPELGTRVRPLWDSRWARLGRPYTWVAELRDGTDRFAWAGVFDLPPNVECRNDESLQVRSYHRQGAEWLPLLDGIMPITTITGICFPRSQDLDGDGDTELIVPEAMSDRTAGRIGRLRIMGKKGKRSERTSAPAPGRGVHGTRPSQPRQAESSALAAARTAEELGLHEEAANWFGQAIRTAATQETLEEAVVGQIRESARAGRHEEAARCLRETVRQRPHLQDAAARAALNAFDAAGEWTLALEAARTLRDGPSVPPAERSALSVRTRELEQLAAPVTVFSLQEDLSEHVDLLASSPLFARLGGERGAELRICSLAHQGLFIPVQNDGSSFRLSGSIATPRQDWETHLEVGLFCGDPWAPPAATWGAGIQGKDFSRTWTYHYLLRHATGDSGIPLRRWQAVTSGTGTRDVRWLATPAEPGPDAAPFTLEYQQRASILRVRLAERGDAGSETLSLDAPPLQDQRAWLALIGRGNGKSPSHWGVFRIASLLFETGGPQLRPAPAQPACATDYLFLANGRWIQGRLDDARKFYDQAIDMADLERRQAEERAGLGLPHDHQTRWSALYVRWTAVDARFWRGLFRAETGDEAGAHEDLLRAWGMDRSRRAQELVQTAGLPLADFPRASALLREMFRASAPPEVAADPRLLAEYLLGPNQEYDALAAALLVGTPYRVRYRLRVVNVIEGPAQPGDEVVEYDGQECASPGDFYRAQEAARDRFRTEVPVRLLRAGRELPLRVDPARFRVQVSRDPEIVER